MDKQPSTLADWSLVQSFLAVADTGSLSGAAQKLGQSQPTIGRHIKALEAHLGIELFQRHARGLTLTAIGADMVPSAREMQRAMAALALTAEARAGSLKGTVRIACSLFFAHHVLPPIIADLRRSAPEISLVVQPSDDSENLLFREADIAIRMYRPTQLELVTQHVADVRMGVFAAKTYLARRGKPTSAEELWTHDLVGYDASRLILDQMAAMGWSAEAEDFAVRCDNHPAYWELICAGCGVGFTQLRVGRADPRVQELTLGIDIPSLPVWLTASPSVRKTPRVDRVWQHLRDHLSAAFQPGDIDAGDPAG